jgi:hypothetical protein
MLNKNISFKKAAYFVAAFFILSSNAQGYKDETKSLEAVKEKAKSFLVQKKKNEAILLFSNFIKTETNNSKINEAADILVRISQTFLSKEAQDAYEGSLNLTSDNLKEAKKLNEGCLALEPQNLDCLIQKIKILYLEKNKFEAEKTYEEDFAFAQGTEPSLWLEAILHKESKISLFKTKNLVKKFNEKPTEEFFILTVLEIERSFMVKNFSRAKDGVEYLEKNFSEYPDIYFFKQKLEAESAEATRVSLSESNPMYATKCKNLTKSLARKFRYDFKMCQRSL